MRHLLLIALSYLLIVSVYAMDIKIAAPSEPGWANKNGLGVTQKIIRKLSKNIPNSSIEIYPEPLKRSLQNFIALKYDCFFGSNAKDFHKEYKLEFIESVPYKKREFFYFIAINKESNIKTVGLMRGLQKKWFINYNEIRNKKVVYFKNMAQAGKLLDEGRIDSIISAKDIIRMTKKPLKIINSENLMPGYDSIVCHANKLNKQFIKKLNEEMNKNRDYIEVELNRFYSNK